ncbi:hypothetical protein [Povalibacter sp.]|uniref:hypothetical protein n=1 Tax=Povalibacter sp. TaxID=1962978 RepID=UPI002F40B6AA
MTHSEDDGRANTCRSEGGSQRAVYRELLKGRFPHVNDVLLHRLMQHATFRELCEEYAACSEALRRLAKPASDEEMRSEYTALSLRLEGELLRYISEHSDRPSR